MVGKGVSTMSLILVVDDSPLCSDLLAVALQGQGFTVAFCSSATARSRIDEVSPALVILDPLNAGLALLQSVRSSERHRMLPVIILTEQSGREAVVQAARLGVRDYMLKSRF